jgi:hypothetical protein
MVAAHGARLLHRFSPHQALPLAAQVFPHALAEAGLLSGQWRNVCLLKSHKKITLENKYKYNFQKPLKSLLYLKPT